MFTRSFPWALAALALASCGTLEPVDMGMPAQYDSFAREAKWGLYGYLAWDNDFTPFCDASDVTRTGSIADRTQNLSAVILRDGASDNALLAPTSRFMGFGDIKHRLTAFQELNTGRAESLGTLLKVARSEAPAPRQVLVISDHGGGIVRGVASDWFGATDAKNRSRKEIIPVRDVAALMSQQPVTITVFDACFMNMAEVAYEMKDATRFIVGSQTTTLIGDFSLPQMAQTLDSVAHAHEDEVAVRLAQNFFQNEQHHVSVSAVDTAQTVPLAEAMRQFTEALDPLVPAKQRAMLDAVRGAQAYARETDPGMTMYNSYRDLIDVVARLGQVDPSLAEPAAHVIEAARRAVLWGQHKSQGPFRNFPFRNVNHLSLYASADGMVEQGYLSSRWAKDTGWGRFLIDLNTSPTNGRSPVVRDPYPGEVPSMVRLQGPRRPVR